MKIKILQTRLGQFSLMFVTEMFCFFIICCNTISYTHGSYFWTAVTDTIYSLQAFLMMKIMTEDDKARSFWSGLGCTLGGTCGSLLAILVTKTMMRI